ncbi:hypothetical protein [Botrimarina sp.]
MNQAIEETDAHFASSFEQADASADRTLNRTKPASVDITSAGMQPDEAAD